MKPENLLNPCCPICGHVLARNGHTEKGKIRYRCTLCKQYNETENSTAHNRTVRHAQAFLPIIDSTPHLCDKLRCRALVTPLGN
jgi:phage FluMu protein Com